MTKKRGYKMDYAYLTKAGIMHIAEKSSAENSKEQGVIVPTDVPNSGGYPTVIHKGKEEQIIVYSEDEMNIEAKGQPIEDAKVLYPHLSELYRKCKG